MKRYLAAAAIIALYLALSAGSALTKRPWCDEAWYASPGLNLATRGMMGTSVLDPASSPWRHQRLDGIDRHTYMALPLHFLTQAVWYKLFGFGLFSLRVLSVLWGLAALAAWFFIVRRLVDERAAALTALLLACDHWYINRASDGRMDMMSAALAACAIAAYLALRERHFARALLAAHALAAASFFTHPNGGIMAFIGLAVFALVLDRHALRWRHAVLIAAPYGLGAAAWGIYILQDPASFRAQFSTAAANRWDGLRAPLTALLLELRLRYWYRFGFAPGSQAASRIYILVPLAYLIGMAGALLNREIRRARGMVALIAFTLVYFAYMVLCESFKTWIYLIYIVPLFTAVLAVWMARVRPRWIAAAALALLVAVQIVRTARVIQLDAYHREYLPAVAFLRAHTPPASLTMGSAELAFQLGFVPRLVDDIMLGYRSGKRADLVVVDDYRYRDNLAELAVEDPEVYRFTSRLLREDYAPVYAASGYTIYARNGLQDSGSGLK